MITAIRENPAFQDEAIRQKIKLLKSYFGIQKHALGCLALEISATSDA